MRLRDRGGRVFALSAFACLLFAAGVEPAAAQFGGVHEEKFKVGDEAADFTTVDLDGNQVTLSSFEGSKVVLLNFWGLRCGACLEEMPYLNEIHKEFKGKDLVILGVDTDGVDAATVVATMKEVGANPEYTILLDLEFTITDTYTNFLVPLTLVIDKKGIVQAVHTGFEKGMEKEYVEVIEKSLGH